MAGYCLAATSLQGAVSEGGRGPSIWDTYASVPGEHGRASAPGRGRGADLRSWPVLLVVGHCLWGPAPCMAAAVAQALCCSCGGSHQAYCTCSDRMCSTKRARPTQLLHSSPCWPDVPTTLCRPHRQRRHSHRRSRLCTPVSPGKVLRLDSQTSRCHGSCHGTAVPQRLGLTSSCCRHGPAVRRTSSSCAPWACATTASRCPGPACSPTAPARSTRQGWERGQHVPDALPALVRRRNI